MSESFIGEIYDDVVLKIDQESKKIQFDIDEEKFWLKYERKTFYDSCMIDDILSLQGLDYFPRKIIRYNQRFLILEPNIELTAAQFLFSDKEKISENIKLSYLKFFF